MKIQVDGKETGGTTEEEDDEDATESDTEYHHIELSADNNLLDATFHEQELFVKHFL